MSIDTLILLIYSLFLLFLMVINFLYFYQVFQYRLPNDASLKVLAFHTTSMVAVLVVSAMLLGAFG